MKTRNLVKMFKRNGWHFLRHGSKHDIYTNGHDLEEIVRHREMNEQLAQALIKKYQLK
ncbi:toxin-antitoxin system, toxin component, HicA family protein [Enterococcus sp. JM4C]|uniref:toxin-antitoxin system, toxin component, HicA family protein n=1 Tax=Candidatus Enterococcus huntleyi TaxID=1857217 RepID=UPI001379D529|nr:toxin-antitoxin system, toxin component, HicA family protein [Enterococcus sp. JM4C]KAF1296569.1 toxin-antitoxin system, toxin component, HicA family protein [Enterococcus sp. JM4C]